MLPVASVTIHCSQFPEAVRNDLVASLRSRRVNHKFHYDSIKQTQKWLTLHQTFSPWLTDPTCRTIYEESYLAAAQRIGAGPVQVIGLGCGGGQKDAALLKVLGKDTSMYTPCDVSTAMVLVARQAALSLIREDQCFPVVCDLATADDPRSFLTPPLKDSEQGHSACILTFFGMMPNFEPSVILPKLSQLTKPGDVLLVSANLAPGANYTAGVERILPFYDNEMTRDWLMGFLLDFGVEEMDGALRFRVEDLAETCRLKRIVAEFHFSRERHLQLDSEQFDFRPGESIRLFFSYRHTPNLLRALLEGYGLEVIDQWITASEEEGVFLVRTMRS
jgi:uncharacterized SAM-dependent methyltransferase